MKGHEKMGNLSQLYWEDVQLEDEIPIVHFPLSIARLVMAAGSNRDFNSIHHNTEYAKATGAPDMYANIIFLYGMWEKAIRDYMGSAGTIKSVKEFRMKAFNTAGETVVIKGQVKQKWLENKEALVELKMWSENSQGTTVGPGRVVITLPRRK